MVNAKTPDLKREQELIQQGYSLIAGIDEAGRGPWAGPVTAGCVIVDSSSVVIEGVNDSKKMTEKKRNELYDKVTKESLAWGVGIVTAEEIDVMGIQEAVKKAMSDALKAAEDMLDNSKVDYIIADGLGIRLIEGYPMEKIKAGDAHHFSIAAASILAKVHRDRLMLTYTKEYPQYGFDSHVGYGTKAHKEALEEYGPCEIHRKSYKPIAKLLSK